MTNPPIRTLSHSNLSLAGFLATLPVTTGLIPFGIVMGVVYHGANLDLTQSMGTNAIVFAGASQLAAVELMSRNVSSAVVILTGLVINLRFLLYSAAFAPLVQRSPLWVKIACAYGLTDQSYSVMSGHEDQFRSPSEAVRFYAGAALCTFIAWHSSVLAGYVFGNFAPESWSLDFAVPLSFAALVVPTLKDRTYVWVAALSSVLSLALYELPYRLGLIATAAVSLLFAAFLLRRKGRP